MELVLKASGKLDLFDLPQEISQTNSIVKNLCTDSTQNCIQYLVESRKNYGKDFLLRDDFKYEYNDKGLLEKFISKSNRVEERLFYWLSAFSKLMNHFYVTYQYDNRGNCTEETAFLPSGVILNKINKCFDNRDKVIEYQYRWEYQGADIEKWSFIPSQKKITLGYNESGLINYIGEGDSKKIYQYDQFSNVVNCRHFINNNSLGINGYLDEKFSFTKDHEGRILSFEKISYIYFPLTSFSIEGFLSSVFSSEKFYIPSENFKFDYQNGGKTVILDHNITYSDSDTSEKYLIEKDDNGRMIRNEFINYNFPSKNPSYKEEFKYDVEGRQIEYVNSKAKATSVDDVVWYPVSKETQFYEQNNLKKIETFGTDANSGNFILNYVVDYSYDSNGFLTEILFSANNKSVFETYQKRVIKNDEFGNVLSDYTYFKVAGEFVFMSGSDFTYKTHQYTKPEYNLPDIRLTPNPAITYIEILSLSEPVTLLIFNSAGEMMKNCTVNPNERISVQDLPKGIYFYNFISDSKAYKGKFLKTDY
jgi:hypothetical protein